MPSDLENLATVKSQIIQRLLEITTNPQPSYSLDGESVSWGDYQRLLLDQLKGIREQIALEGAPYELATVAMS